MKRKSILFLMVSLLLFIVLPGNPAQAGQASQPGASTQSSGKHALLPVVSLDAALNAAAQDETFKLRFQQAMLAVYNARTRQDLEAAAEEFLAARSLNPSNPEVHYNLGLVYLELDEYARAGDFFEDYLRLAPNPDEAARASGLLSRARLLEQRFDRAIEAMLNPRAWRLLEVKPAELDSSWFSPEFRLAKDGQLLVKNPRLNYKPLDKEPSTKRNPWLPLTFRGRYFEFLVCLARERICNAGQGHCLIQSEIVFDGPRVLVIARNFRYDPYLKQAEKGAGYIAVYELVL
ncbi:MAG: tetratricopeptide repeat protein [Candidatus Saccharicenans sp.]|nr:tetratricopeptide repeat protein [Candidatus Saccharicenans sp.]